MDFTGEQNIPGKGKKRIEEEHFARYNFALDFASGKSVLDIACGVGYGSGILARVAKKVVGVDVSEASIEYAKNNFQLSNTEFVLASAADDLFAEESFDLICSFETVEHLESAQKEIFLDNLKKWLKKDGLLILSTPNKKIVSPFTEKPVNKFHIFEYDEKELRSDISKRFVVKEILGQRLVKRIYTSYLARKLLNFLSRLYPSLQSVYNIANGPQVRPFDQGKREPRIFIVLCKKN